MLLRGRRLPPHSTPSARRSVCPPRTSTKTPSHATSTSSVHQYRACSRRLAIRFGQPSPRLGPRWAGARAEYAPPSPRWPLSRLDHQPAVQCMYSWPPVISTAASTVPSTCRIGAGEGMRLLDGWIVGQNGTETLPRRECKRSSGTGTGRSSSCSRKIDWIADEHGGLRRPSKRFKAEERKRTAEFLSHKTGNSVKRRNTWSQDEDDILIQMVGPHCKNKWSDIARSIPGRSREQCRERWMFYLDPAVNNQPWSEQEDITLIRAHRILGNKWCKLAKHFPGRTGKAIKNRWHTLMNGKRNSDYVRGLTIDNKCSGTIKSGQDSCINIQVAVDCPIRPKPEQGFTEDGRNAALKKKGSDSMYSERYVSVNVSERQIARSSLPVVIKEKEAMPSSSVVQKVSCVAAKFSTSLEKKESTNCLEAPLNGVDAGFYPARDHEIHDHFDDICSSAHPESQLHQLANVAELLDMSYCDSLMIIPPDSPNDGNSMEGTRY